MPNDPLKLFEKMVQRGVSPGVVSPVARAGAVAGAVRPETMAAMTEPDGRRIFCVGFDTVGDANAVVR